MRAYVHPCSTRYSGTPLVGSCTFIIQLHVHVRVHAHVTEAVTVAASHSAADLRMCCQCYLQARQLADSRQAAADAAEAATKLVRQCAADVSVARGTLEDTREIWAVQQGRVRVCVA